MIDIGTGLVGKKLNGSIIVPEQVRLSADSLYLEWELGDAKARRFQEGAFDDFLLLASGTSDILRYAKKWGTLHVNWHPAGARLSEPPASRGRDSVEEWVYFSARAGAILDLVSDLKNGHYGSMDSWSKIAIINSNDPAGKEHLESLVKYRLPAHWLGDLRELKAKLGLSKSQILDRLGAVLARELDAWIQLAGIAVEARFLGMTSPIPWEAAVTWKSRLFAALALQLLYAVSGQQLRYTCHSCGKTYSRKRRQTYGREHFCSACGRRAAVRMAERRRREKIIEAIDLASKGIDVRTIAQKLNTKSATVQGWLRKKNGGKSNDQKTRSK